MHSMHVITGILHVSLTITRCIGIGNSDIKQCLPQKPLAWMSALVLQEQLDEDGVISSLLSGSNGGGSTVTPWHTSCIHSAVKFHSSLRWTKVEPPCQQIMA